MTISVPTSGLLTINVTAPDATAFAWDFGDGTTGSGLTATHDYAETGIYIATLAVTDADGNVDTSQSLISIPDPLLLDIDVVSGALVEQSSYASTISSPTPTFTAGRDGGEALVVNATGGVFAQSFDVPQLFLLDAMSLYCGFKATGAGNIVAFNTAFSVVVNASGELVVDVTNSDGTNYDLATSGAGLLDGNWHDVTVVWQGWTDGVEGGALTIYVDGAAAGSIAVAGTMNADDSRDLWGFGTGSADGVVGEMDHLRIYGHAQSAAEVAAEHGAV